MVRDSYCKKSRTSNRSDLKRKSHVDLKLLITRLKVSKKGTEEDLFKTIHVSIGVHSSGHSN